MNSMHVLLQGRWRRDPSSQMVLKNLPVRVTHLHLAPLSKCRLNEGISE